MLLLSDAAKMVQETHVRLMVWPTGNVIHYINELTLR